MLISWGDDLEKTQVDDNHPHFPYSNSIMRIGSLKQRQFQHRQLDDVP
jgi:hypothetical protein